MLEGPQKVRPCKASKAGSKALQEHRNVCYGACSVTRVLARSPNHWDIGSFNKAPPECVTMFLRSQSGITHQIPLQRLGKDIMTTQDPGRGGLNWS